ncbi:hypothetical protein DM02DRAFT_364472 [Periconia macrospinosa]|uniref:Uncharacterized protein n=1 Tax=Periconia macrospinosa TaxID=97972 RepID=A0A2V1CZK1_9PLEO|nr:hypothetical protein DM02DRAFT_364472 [Periconia macrospinosa]
MTYNLFGNDGIHALIYNADNLLPTTTTHTTPVRTLGQPDTDYIKRNSSPVTRALFLYLKDPCTFLCPDIPGSITHKPSHESAFTQLVGLLKETEIEILFDWNYLHKDQHHPFSTIVSQPEQLRGFPIDEKNLRGRKLGNWTIFSPTEPFVPTDPPPYADARQKRSRDVSTTPPFAPSPKRVFYIPQGSPTEKATTITMPDDMDNLAKDKLEELEVTATAYVEEALEQMDKRLKQMESAMNKRLDTFLSNFRKRAPYGEPHTAEASYQKPNRYGCTAGHRRRHKHRGRIRQQ